MSSTAATATTCSRSDGHDVLLFPQDDDEIPGRDWRTLGNNRSYTRGERQFQLEPYQKQMDWLKQQVEDGAVMGVAFPVR